MSHNGGKRYLCEKVFLPQLKKQKTDICFGGAREAVSTKKDKSPGKKIIKTTENESDLIIEKFKKIVTNVDQNMIKFEQTALKIAVHMVCVNYLLSFQTDCSGEIIFYTILFFKVHMFVFQPSTINE